MPIKEYKFYLLKTDIVTEGLGTFLYIKNIDFKKEEFNSLYIWDRQSLVEMKNGRITNKYYLDDLLNYNFLVKNDLYDLKFSKKELIEIINNEDLMNKFFNFGENNE